MYEKEKIIDFDCYINTDYNYYYFIKYKKQKKENNLEKVISNDIESNNLQLVSNLTNTEVSNKVTNTTSNTEQFIPKGMNIDNGENTNNIIENTLEINHIPDNVTIEVVENTATNSKIEILITDTNEDKYCWVKNYKVQVKENDNWSDLEPIKELKFNDLEYKLDENGKFIQKINWTRFYGELEKGIYRIVKPIYDVNLNSFVDFISNEFEVK